MIFAKQKLMPKHSCAYFLTEDVALGLINLSLSGLSFTILKQGCRSKRKTTNIFFKYYQAIQRIAQGFLWNSPSRGWPTQEAIPLFKNN
jgi:hypothetical protein